MATEAAACQTECINVCEDKNYQKAVKLRNLIFAINNFMNRGLYDKAQWAIAKAKEIC